MEALHVKYELSSMFNYLHNFPNTLVRRNIVESHLLKELEYIISRRKYWRWQFTVFLYYTFITPTKDRKCSVVACTGKVKVPQAKEIGSIDDFVWITNSTGWSFAAVHPRVSKITNLAAIYASPTPLYIIQWQWGWILKFISIKVPWNCALRYLNTKLTLKVC